MILAATTIATIFLATVILAIMFLAAATLTTTITMICVRNPCDNYQPAMWEYPTHLYTLPMLQVASNHQQSCKDTRMGSNTTRGIMRIRSYPGHHLEVPYHSTLQRSQYFMVWQVSKGSINGMVWYWGNYVRVKTLHTPAKYRLMYPKKTPLHGCFGCSYTAVLLLTRHFQM